MSIWRNLPEGVVALVAAKFDGPRSDVVRALRRVCKPWSAEITTGIARATMFDGAEAGVQHVLKTTPKLRSLKVTGTTWETLLADIRSVKHLVPELKSFVFDRCDLYSCETLISQCLTETTTGLDVRHCTLKRTTVSGFHELRKLTSLTPLLTGFESTGTRASLCAYVFSLMPSLRFVELGMLEMRMENVRASDLPNLTRLSIRHSVIWHPDFLRGLTRLEHLNVSRTHIVEYDGDLPADLPTSITSLDLCNMPWNEHKILTEGLFRLASRLTLLSSLDLGTDDQVTNGVLAALGSMPSLTRLYLYNYGNVTDAGLASLAPSKLFWLELRYCSRMTREGVDALRATAPCIEIVYDA
jgi:hypothetical protein